jgi:uncharacterized lipoprotein YbaY
MRCPKRVWALVVGSALSVSLAACSSGGKSGGTPSASATTGGTATAQITANWEEFFNAKTPVSRRVQLLQNGQVFAAVISAQAGSGLASQASAKVSKVTVTSASQATVNYSILVAGQTALPNQTGVAVLEDGIWKVGDSSFCGLLAMEAGGSTSGLPAPCVSST